MEDYVSRVIDLGILVVGIGAGISGLTKRLDKIHEELRVLGLRATASEARHSESESDIEGLEDREGR